MSEELNNRVVKSVKSDWIYRLFTLTSDNISEFEIQEDRRNINARMVNNVKWSLAKGVHFGNPLSVNRRDGHYRIIDGNHRFEGCKLFLEAYPDRKVEVPLSVYTDLSDAEERIIYDIGQNSRNESVPDFIQRHQKEIPIIIMIQQKFPCTKTIYPSKTSISMLLILDAYIGARSYTGAVSLSANNIDRCKRYMALTEDDYHIIVHFMRDFKDELGGPENNKWMKRTPFTAILRLYLDNVINGDKSAKTFWKDFKKCTTKADVLELVGLGGGAAQKRIHEKIMNYMNRGKKSTKHLYELKIRGKAQLTIEEEMHGEENTKKD